MSATLNVLRRKSIEHRVIPFNYVDTYLHSFISKNNIQEEELHKISILLTFSEGDGMYEMMAVINVRSLWNLLVNIHIIIKHIAQEVVHYHSSS